MGISKRSTASCRGFSSPDPASTRQENDSRLRGKCSDRALFFVNPSGKTLCERIKTNIKNNVAYLDKLSEF